MRAAVPVEQRVALTLWFLATNADHRTIGHLFCVSKPTVCDSKGKYVLLL